MMLCLVCGSEITDDDTVVRTDDGAVHDYCADDGDGSGGAEVDEDSLSVYDTTDDSW
jgi:hypothetical protein